MFEDSDTRNKHVWLIELLSQPRTLKEIQECWKLTDINPYPGTAMTRKTVFNWINKIEELYGISIQVTKAGANSNYQIGLPSGRRQRQEMAAGNHFNAE